jgi:hypothetical protein
MNLHLSSLTTLTSIHYTSTVLYYAWLPDPFPLLGSGYCSDKIIKSTGKSPGKPDQHQCGVRTPLERKMEAGYFRGVSIVKIATFHLALLQHGPLY